MGRERLGFDWASKQTWWSSRVDWIKESREIRGVLGTRNRRTEGNGRRVGSDYSRGKDTLHAGKMPRNNRGGLVSARVTRSIKYLTKIHVLVLEY